MVESGFDDLVKKSWVAYEVGVNPMLHLKSQLKSLKGHMKLWRSQNFILALQMAAKQITDWELCAELEDFRIISRHNSWKVEKEHHSRS